jgi:F0F1-type ATP synthase assembly protein I
VNNSLLESGFEDRYMTTANSQMVSRGLRIQTIVALVLAGGLMLVGPVAAYSSLFGSLTAYIPALFFALLVVPKFGADSVTFLRTAAVAEVAKIFLTGLLCAAVFIWVKPLAPGWFFAGMVAGIFSGRLGLLVKS